MRLKTIKLAGFKSFVDATTLSLPSNLIGVVGPNGCGKSNIIDAVRWVMGESSARLLRGESMADVIFNGSNARKPVGTAMVELVFDNADGAAGGAYARYSEIAIRRQVSRDGQSLYFLNGTRCRRRDITDIFLGTGLGPRSYSIIEQGMISRIVEAKPEEIRSYLEEAAGISKYKERRRETENRIRHTRENLARLTDLREEVSKHLDRLQRQARQAERYQALKADYRTRELEHRALQWRAFDVELRERRRLLAEQETALEAAVAELRAAEAAIEAGRERHGEASRHANRVQGELYERGAEVARLEQAIAHRRELQEQQRRQQQEAEEQWQSLASHVDLDKSHLAQLRGELERAEPALARARTREAETAERFATAEEAVGAWQADWDAFTTTRGEAAQATEVERTRIEALDRSLEERSRRIERLEQEESGLATRELEAALERLGEEREGARARQEALEEQLGAVREALRNRAEDNRSRALELTRLRERYQEITGRLSSLEALQQAALGEDAEALKAWLGERGLAGAPRLAQVLRVDPGFEEAVETALGALLEAVVVPDPWALARDGRWPEAGIALVSDGTPADGGARTGLAAHVEGPAAVAELLAATAREDDPGAGAAIEPGRRVVLPGNVLAGRHWIRVRGQRPTAGVLAREKEIAGLREQRDRSAAAGQALREQLEAGEAALADHERRRDEAQQALNLQIRRVAELDGQRQSRQARVEAVRARARRLREELAQLGSQVAVDESTVRNARQRLQKAVDRMAELEVARGRLDARRRELFEARDQARREAREARERAQELAIGIESRRSAVLSTEQALERTGAQLRQLEERRTALRAEIERTGSPLGEEQERLQALLAERLAVEKRLAEARAAADAIAEEVRQHEARRQEIDARAAALRSDVQAQQVAQEGLRVQAEGLAREVAGAGAALEEVLAALDEQARAEAWAEALEALERRIRRLEPVNLAAIEEYEQEQERKRYLDAQNEDLEQALETLERAIRKIDRETRTRFKETFDQVNAGVQALFPRLFGGGHAYLELVGEDLLEAGVAIMARPPGKRISNIHLLSGGEKALTAVSFVFAIFQLNPAPFCMLDEVDAPLDDANVGRFSDMVRDMSEQVQFVVVTHNKITMAITHQLMGVTMREPGVSRMVSVDVAEAERMAAS